VGDRRIRVEKLIAGKKFFFKKLADFGIHFGLCIKCKALLFAHAEIFSKKHGEGIGRKEMALVVVHIVVVHLSGWL